MINKKTSIIVITAIIILLAGVYVLSNKSQKTQANVVKVAAILNMTGPSAQFDAIKQRTLEVAEARIGKIYPMAALSLKIFDAGGGPESTNTAIKRAKEWGADYYLSGTSPTALAIAAELRNTSSSVVQMANAANPEFGPPKIGEYRLWPDWKQEAHIIAELIKVNRFTSVLVLYSADPYSESLKQSLKESIPDDGNITTVYQQFDPASSPDFRPALVRGMADKMSAVVVFGLPPSIRALISQMKQVKWNGAVVGGININLNVGEFKTSGLAGPLWSLRTPTMSNKVSKGTETAAFRKAYEEKYRETPPFHAVYLADAIYLIAAAHHNRPKLNPVEAMRQIREVASASGTIHITNDGVLRYQITSKKMYPDN